MLAHVELVYNNLDYKMWSLCYADIYMWPQSYQETACLCVLLHLPHNNENCLTFRAVIMLDTHGLIII